VRSLKRTSTVVEPRRLGLVRREWLLVATVILIVGLPMHPYRAQQASRYTLTAAIVDRGTVVLDEYVDVLGIDRAVRDGHTYSDKAPGQPFLATPFYAAGRLVGVEDATNLRVDRNLGLWWVTLWSAAIPGAVVVLMMYRRALREDEDRALVASMSVFFGTLLFPFSTVLFGHVLAAMLLYLSYMLLIHRPRTLVMVGAGLAAGLAVAVEYTAIIGVVILGVFCVARHGKRALAWVSGGLPVAVALGVYNLVAFGDPLVLSYQFSAFEQVTETSRPLFDMFSAASVENLVRLVFDGRGLLFAMPIVLVGVGAAVWGGLRGKEKGEAWLALAMILAFLVLPVVWGNPWGGDSPGPRYIVPALPFLLLPVVWAWRRWPRVTTLAAVLGAITMLAATVTDPFLDRFTSAGLGAWLSFLRSGETVDTLATMVFGTPLGWTIHVVLILALVIALISSHRSGSKTAVVIRG
jgi:hypothetical protein